MTDIIVTMPDLEKEGIEALKKFYSEQKGEIYFKVSKLPLKCKIGEYCLIVCNGEIIGKHKIVNMCFVHEKEASELSHGNWTAGNYIIRDAKSFIPDNTKTKFKGFQGFRYVK